MKKLLLITLLSISLHADMNKEEIIKEGLYQVLVYEDYLQTKEILRNPDYFERNPLITEDNIEEYFIGGALLHASISYFLPRPYKKWFQNITLSFGALNIYNNVKIGVGFKF